MKVYLIAILTVLPFVKSQINTGDNCLHLGAISCKCIGEINNDDSWEIQCSEVNNNNETNLLYEISLRPKRSTSSILKRISGSTMEITCHKEISPFKKNMFADHHITVSPKLLHFDGCPLPEVAISEVLPHPESIKELKYLSGGDRANNILIPSLLNGLINLKRMYLTTPSETRSHGIVKTIPENLFVDNRNLEVLDITDWPFHEIGANTFRNLTKLEKLRLQTEELTSLPETIFSDLLSLEKLTVRFNAPHNSTREGNRLEKLGSNTFRNLRKLTDLYLIMPWVNELPESSFFNLSKLENLQLSFPNLVNVSNLLLSKLTKLETFEIDCGIQKLHHRLLANNNKLEEFTASFSNLREIEPSVFGGKNKLKGIAIKCSTRNLTSIPDNLLENLSKLENFDLEEANLTRLPEDFFSSAPALEEIKMHKIGLKNLLPNTLNRNQKLKRLDLSDNELETLPPQIFKNLKKLKYLYLNGNHLTTLPLEIFQDLKKLENLYVTHNRLSSLPAQMFEHLEELEFLGMSENSLSELDVSFLYHLRDLENAYFANNNITHLINEQVPSSFDRSTTFKINVFDLSHNLLTKIPELDYHLLGSNLFLNLAENRIPSINITSQFRNTKNRINLENNLIKTVVVPEEKSLYGQYLLANNPFECNCTLLPFQRYLIESQSKPFVEQLFPYADKINCAIPPCNVSMLHINENFFNCPK